MRYAILLYDGVEPIDVGATFGVLSMARRRVPDIAFFGVARKSGPVTCANRLVVMAEHDFTTCPDVDDLIVTGGPGWTAASQDAETLAFLKARQGATRTSAICTGAMILAAAGLLDGRSATTKREVYAGETSPLDLLDEMDAIDAEPAALLESRGVLTSGGVTLGIDAMFRLLARNHGSEVADDVARVMEYRRALAANRSALGYRGL
jgi:transcriptional regulator GlxA family with amidase domain